MDIDKDAVPGREFLGIWPSGIDISNDKAQSEADEAKESKANAMLVEEREEGDDPENNEEADRGDDVPAVPISAMEDVIHRPLPSFWAERSGDSTKALARREEGDKRKRDR